MRDKQQTPGATSQEPVAEHGDSHPAHRLLDRWKFMLAAAGRWNRAHWDLVERFSKVTGIDGANVRQIREWQLAHGLAGDGKVGTRTVRLAESEAKPQADVTFTDAEAGTVGKQQAQGDLAAEAVAGGETGGMEHAEHEASFEGDQMLGEGAEVAAADLGGKTAGTVAGKAVLVPHLVLLLRRHDFGGALKFVWSSVGQEERVELLKLVAEKLTGELSEHALLLFEKAALAGAVVGTLELGFEWLRFGVEAVREAHERGEQRSRIGIYAYAWSDFVVRGEHSNPGAITAEEREAMERGKEEGALTRLSHPELPVLLKFEYGDEKAARLALEERLMKAAGL